MSAHMERSSEDRLEAVLREWKELHPPANFEAMVWRRIRTVPVSEPLWIRFAGSLRDALLFQPAQVTAVAASLAILVGVWVGLRAPAGTDRHLAEEPLLHSRTLAGSYLAMATGVNR